MCLAVEGSIGDKPVAPMTTSSVVIPDEVEALPVLVEPRHVGAANIDAPMIIAEAKVFHYLSLMSTLWMVPGCELGDTAVRHCCLVRRWELDSFSEWERAPPSYPTSPFMSKVS